MELRGFDSYAITLGDEMRGERASLGKDLEDVARDLCMKIRMIVAIENCDLEGFPNRSVVAGYVRSYARYLGMDADDCYRRFCTESGYQSPGAAIAAEAARTGGALRRLPIGGSDAGIARSRFAAPPARGRYMAPVSLGAVTSTLALLALMAGLGYGGYALLQDIQRVGFAPIPQAPAVVARAPLIAAPQVEADLLPLPEASAYQEGGLLAAMASPPPLAPIGALGHDGPISAIDPQTAGVFAPRPQPEPEPTALAHIDSANDAIRVARLDRQQRGAAGALATATGAAASTVGGGATGVAGLDDADPAALQLASAVGVGPGKVALHAAEKAWIRVQGGGNVLFEGILDAGAHYELPDRAEAPEMKVGNAGGIFILVDGVPYGPLGKSGQIARHVSLAADDIRASLPRAARLDTAGADGGLAEMETAQR